MYLLYFFLIIFYMEYENLVWFLDGEAFCWRADFRDFWGKAMVSENCLLEQLRGGGEGVEIL